MNKNLKKLEETNQFFMLLQSKSNLSWIYTRYLYDDKTIGPNILYEWKKIKKTVLNFRISRSIILAFVLIGIFYFSSEFFIMLTNYANNQNNPSTLNNAYIFEIYIYAVLCGGLIGLMGVSFRFSYELIDAWVESNWTTIKFVDDIELLAEIIECKSHDKLLLWLLPDGQELIGQIIPPYHVSKRCREVLFSMAAGFKKSETNLLNLYLKMQINNFHQACLRLRILPANDNVGQYYRLVKPVEKDH